MYTHISTENDIMKESLIYGAELEGKYGFPALDPFDAAPDKTVDFRRSKKLIDVKNLNLRAVSTALVHVFDRFCKCFFNIPTQSGYSVV